MKEVDDFLAHYGILGMKWGIRRKRGKDGLVTNKVVNPSDDFKKAADLATKRPSEMSNEELKVLTSRLQLEKQYKELTSASQSKGKKFVTDVLQNAGKQVATTYTAKYMTEMMERMLKKKTEKAAG